MLFGRPHLTNMQATHFHPAGLLHSFAGMPSSAAGAEGLDLQFACAFNLPAVLHTLGPPAWPALRPAFDWLTGSGEARNRCTLACSLHEVARMVGPQTAQRDLMRAARVSHRSASAGATSTCLLAARCNVDELVQVWVCLASFGCKVTVLWAPGSGCGL